MPSKREELVAAVRLSSVQLATYSLGAGGAPIGYAVQKGGFRTPEILPSEYHVSHIYMIFPYYLYFLL